MKLEKGYAVITRKWSSGDSVSLDLPMPVRRVLAHDKITVDTGCVALERGPLVYCAEWKDNGGEALRIVLDDGAKLTAEHRKDMLGGVTVIKGTLKGGREFLAIPYYARSNRGNGEMNVWFGRTEEAAKRIPVPPKRRAAANNPAAWGPFRASHIHPPDTLKALNDKKLPKNSRDLSIPRFTWWSHRGSSEWIEYSLAKPTKVSSVEVYWFDDTGTGGCRVPKSWRVLYRDGDKWTPLSNTCPYGVEVDRLNKVTFREVTTSALRLEVRLRNGFSGGILEWRV